MLNLSYDAILGLGEWCGVAHNLRRHFRMSSAYPMDWWIAQYEATCRLFDDSFANLFRPENLSIDPARDSVWCKHYGVAHTHDFLRDAAGNHFDNLAQQIPALQEKYRALISRMDAQMSSGNVLAVRHRLRSANGSIPSETLQEMAIALHKRLTARWPAAIVDLLVIESGPAMTLQTSSGRIVFDTLDDTAELGHWQPKAWDALLHRQGVQLMRQRRQLASGIA